MRYHSKSPNHNFKVFGETFVVNHMLYNSGTLFQIKKKGLVIIQQYFNSEKKTTYWGPVDNWLANLVYCHKDFLLLFEKYASERVNGLYPTITIRHAMYWLKIKPIKKEVWETVFDRTII